jgi:hypothetical protein
MHKNEPKHAPMIPTRPLKTGIALHDSKCSVIDSWDGGAPCDDIGNHRTCKNAGEPDSPVGYRVACEMFAPFHNSKEDILGRKLGKISIEGPSYILERLSHEDR